MTEISSILIFLAGGIIGFVLCRITIGRKPTAAQQQKLDNSKAELDHYKSQVNKHFTSSAELMEQVANSYQALYTHMAGQSHALLSDSDADALPFPQLKTPSEKKQGDTPDTKDIAQETAENTTAEVTQTDTAAKTDEVENAAKNYAAEPKTASAIEIDQDEKLPGNNTTKPQTDSTAESDEVAKATELSNRKNDK